MIVVGHIYDHSGKINANQERERENGITTGIHKKEKKEKKRKKKERKKEKNSCTFVADRKQTQVSLNTAIVAPAAPRPQ